MAATQGLDVYEVRLADAAAAPRYVAAADADAAVGALGLGRHEVRRIEALPRHLYDPPCAEGLSHELVALAAGGGEVERHEAIRIVEGLRAGVRRGAFLKACRRGIRPEEIYAGEDPVNVWHEAAPAGCLALTELLAAARAAGAGISESDEARVYAVALRERLVSDVARRANEILEEDW